MSRLLLLLAALFALSPAMAAPALKAPWEAGAWSRCPQITVPPLKNTPVIDGAAWPQEGWEDASSTSGFIDSDGGGLPRYVTQMQCGYTKDALYLTFRVGRPRWQPTPTATFTAGHHPHIWVRDDNVEITLVPAPPKASADGPAKWVYVWVGNANGAFSSGRVPSRPGGQLDSQWVAPWEYKARMLPEGWEGELRVPFAGLGRQGPPAAGSEWQLDVMNQPVTPERRLVSWAEMWGSGDYLSGRKGLLRFLAEPLATRLGHFGKLEQVRPGDAPQMGMRGILRSGVAQERPMELQYTLYRAAQRRAPGDATFYKLWDELLAVRERRQVVDTKAATQALRGEADLVRELSTRYVPYKEASFALPVREGHTFLPIQLPRETGEYVLAYRIHEPKSGVVHAEQVLPYAVLPSLDLEVIPHLLHFRKLAVTGRFEEIEGLAKGDTVRFDLLPAAGEAPLATADARYDGEKDQVEVVLPADALAPGKYRVRGRVLGAGNRTLAEAVTEFERPANPEWAGNRLGYEPAVPWPWAPVKTAGTNVSVVGREYRFEGQALPRQVITQGEPLLAGPISLALRAGGAAVPLPAAVLKEQAPDRATLEASGQAAGLRVGLRTQVEFDGCIRADLTLDPGGRPVSLEELTLRIPVLAKHATLYHAGGFTTDPKRFNGMRWEAGAIEQWFATYKEKGAMSFARNVFLGGPDRGIQWFAESERGWSVQDEDAVLALERGKEEVVLVARLVNKAVQIREPITFTWGMIATPVKPPAPQSRYYAQYPYGSIFDDVKSPEAQQKTAKTLADVKSLGMDRAGCYATQEKYFGAPREFDAEYEDLLKRWTAAVHAAGLKATYYSGWGVNSSFPGFQSFGKEMLNVPFRNSGFGCYWLSPVGPFADYFCHGVQHMMRDIGFDGVYLDGTVIPPLDLSALAGHRWERAGDGAVHGTYPIWAMREFVKRLYRTVHTLRPDEVAFVEFHNSLEPLFYIEGFSDGRVTGEADYDKGASFDAIFTPERFLAGYATQPHGLRSTLLWWNWNRKRVKANEMRTLTLLHGMPQPMGGELLYARDQASYDRHATPWARLLAILRPWQAAGSEFHPYWEDRFIETGDEKVKVSLYRKTDRSAALAVLGNWSNEGRRIRFRLDPKALGITPAGDLRVRDAMQNLWIIPEPDDWYLLDVAPQGYRLLEVTGR